MSSGIVLYDFTPTSEDEINVEEYDLISVIERRNDGWSFVKRSKDHICGLIPTSYIRHMNLDAILKKSLLISPKEGKKCVSLTLEIEEPQLAVRKSKLDEPIKAYKVCVNIFLGTETTPVTKWSVWRTYEQFYILYRNIHNLFEDRMANFPVQTPKDIVDYRFTKLVPGSLPPMLIWDYEGEQLNIHGVSNIVEDEEALVDNFEDIKEKLQIYFDELILKNNIHNDKALRSRWMISFLSLQNPLLFTVANNLDELNFMKSSHSLNVNAKDDMGRSCLHLAAFLGHEELVKFFISNGTLITCDNENKTPMEMTGDTGREVILNILKKKYGIIGDIDYQSLFLIEKSKVSALERELAELRCSYETEISLLRSLVEKKQPKPQGKPHRRMGSKGKLVVGSRKGVVMKKRAMAGDIDRSKIHWQIGRMAAKKAKSGQQEHTTEPVSAPTAWKEDKPKRQSGREDQIEAYLHTVFPFEWMDGNTTMGENPSKMWTGIRERQQMEQLGKLESEETPDDLSIGTDEEEEPIDGNRIRE